MVPDCAMSGALEVGEEASDFGADSILRFLLLGGMFGLAVAGGCSYVIKHLRVCSSARNALISCCSFAQSLQGVSGGHAVGVRRLAQLT